MGETSRYDFCPKCGALARDGVCQSCGYHNPAVPMQAAQPQQPQQVQPGQNQQPPYQSYYVPPAQPSRQHGPHTTVLVCVILSILLVVVIGLILVGVYDIQKRYTDRENHEVISRDNGLEEEDGWQDYEKDKKQGEEDASAPVEEELESAKPSYSHYRADVTRENWEEEGQDSTVPYYSGPYNALRDDLSYEIAFTEQVCYGENKDIFVCVEYPQLADCEHECRDYINAVLAYEYDYYVDFVKEKFEPLMSREEDRFYCQVDSFVTYMDEKHLSVVFWEEIYMELEADPMTILDFYCLNFDLETGTILENTEILRMDEDFAIDFRKREVEENGEGALTRYTDQEILKMLQDGNSLVLFYTPMGLEVGLNLEDMIVYVTYEDYERFLNSF